MSVVAQIVDWSALAQTALAALVGGVGIALAFSLGILGASRLSDSTRQLGLFGIVGYGTLTVVSLLASLAAIVFGIVVMTSS